MRGTVIGFDEATKTGAIGVDERTRFEFEFSEWRSATTPYAGQSVDFLADGNNARQIFALTAKGLNVSRSRVASKMFEVSLRLVFASCSGLLAVILVSLIVANMPGDHSASSWITTALAGGSVAGYVTGVDWLLRLLGFEKQREPTEPLSPEKVLEQRRKREQAFALGVVALIVFVVVAWMIDTSPRPSTGLTEPWKNDPAAPDAQAPLQPASGSGSGWSPPESDFQAARTKGNDGRVAPVAPQDAQDQ